MGSLAQAHAPTASWGRSVASPLPAPTRNPHHLSPRWGGLGVVGATAVAAAGEGALDEQLLPGGRQERGGALPRAVPRTRAAGWHRLFWFDAEAPPHLRRPRLERISTPKSTPNRHRYTLPKGRLWITLCRDAILRFTQKLFEDYSWGWRRRPRRSTQQIRKTNTLRRDGPWTEHPKIPKPRIRSKSAPAEGGGAADEVTRNAEQHTQNTTLRRTGCWTDAPKLLKHYSKNSNRSGFGVMFEPRPPKSAKL